MSEETAVPEINGPTGEVVVYEAPDGGARVEVVVGGDTVWLTQAQMVELFDRQQRVIARHIGNVFREGELPRESSMQGLHRPLDGGRPVTSYSLDVIISVGYRVKSARGTQFRKWANGVLRDNLLRGYTLNEKRLLARGVEFDQAVALLTATLRRNETLTPEGQAILQVVQHHARTWRMLRAYDEDQLSAAPGRTSASDRRSRPRDGARGDPPRRMTSWRGERACRRPALPTMLAAT